MASLNTTGSMANNPTQGLIKPNMSSAINAPLSGASQQSNLQGQSYYQNLASSGSPSEKIAGQNWLANHPQAPTASPVSHTVITSPDGTSTTTQKFAPTTGSTSGVLSKSTAPQVGNQQQNAQNVLNASNLNNNPQYQALASQSGLLTQAQNNVNTAGTAGSVNTVNQAGNDILGNRYTDLFRAQSTGNLQGEKGILNPYLVNAQAGNTAEANRLLAGGQLATTGASNVLSAGQPQQVSPTNVPFNPLTGTYGAPASTAYGAGGLSGVGALQQQQNQGADVQTMTSSLKQTSGLIDKAKKDIVTAGFNPSPVALGNYLTQYLQGKVVPDPQYANVVNDISEIANTIAPVLGTPGNPTDLKTTIAQELIPRLMAGEDIGTVLDNLEKNAGIKIDAARTASQNNAVSNPSSGSTGGGYATSW